MPRPKQYDSSAERARAWRERRGEELREELARRLRDADDATIDRLVNMIPPPALMRLNRALEWAEHPERASESEHRHGRGDHRHGPRRHGHDHHRAHGPMRRRHAHHDHSE
ncbi:MAG: hypothetical protein ABI572_13025 [Actinomycetota bacterium]